MGIVAAVITYFIAIVALGLLQALLSVPHGSPFKLARVEPWRSIFTVARIGLALGAAVWSFVLLERPIAPLPLGRMIEHTAKAETPSYPHLTPIVPDIASDQASPSTGAGSDFSGLPTVDEIYRPSRK